MSVVSADRLTGRSGNATADVREHEEIWEVITSTATDTQEEIIDSGMIPLGFDSFPADPAARVSRLRFDQDRDEPTYWLVHITYTTRQPSPGVDPGGGTQSGPGGSPSANYTDDPREKPAKVSFRTETIQTAIQRDLDDNLIADATGRPFVTQTVEDNGVILSIQKNLAALPFAILRDYRNAVNSDNYFGIPAGHAKILSMRADSNYDKEVFYWSLAVDMFVADDEWIARYGALDYLTLLNRGPEYLDASGNRHSFLTSTGQPTEGNLDPDGTTATTENYLAFRVRPRLPFVALGIYP